MVVSRPERSVERFGLPCLQRAAPAIDTIAYKKPSPRRGGGRLRVREELSAGGGFHQEQALGKQEYT
jgi:hypothetical protein